MDTSLTANEMRQRTRLPALRAVIVAGLVGNVVAFTVLQALVLRALIPELAVILVLTLIIAAVCATRWRGAPHLVVFWAVLSVIPGLEPYWYDLTHPAETGTFIADLTGLVLLFVAVVASLAAIRAGSQAVTAGYTPGWLRGFLLGTATFVLGASVVASIPAPDASAGVSAAALAQLPALVAGRNTFDQAELRARVGETIALRLENTDTMVHSFDIDAFDVHVSMPTGTPALALFTATTPGSYTFYCRIPGHTEAGMVGTLIVEL
jgi:plastocyanin